MTPISISRSYGDKGDSRRLTRIGEYHIREKLGEGGMGTVYRVEHAVTGDIRAAKVLKPRLRETQSEKRFKREFRALKSLDHPSIVRVDSLESDDSGWWMIMECVPGESFKAVIRRDCIPDRPWINRVWEWIREICTALEHIHEHRMVHRDLKPSNIMILPETPRTKLLDFGLIQTDEYISGLTEPRVIMGSMIYMSPEQAVGDYIDVRSDLYSLGIMIYEAMTGKPPFVSRDPLTMLGLHQLRDPEPPRKLNPQLTQQEEILILRLLAKRPRDRFPSARETGELIQEILLPSTPASHPDIPLVSWAGNLLEPSWIGGREIRDSLRKIILDVLTGGVHLALIRGEAGIGKSRFIQEMEKTPELLHQLMAQGGFMDGDVLYGGIIRAVEKALRDYRAKYGAESADAIEWNYETVFFSTGEIREAAVKTLDVLRTVSRDGPVFLFLDDLQLAGRSDLQFLTSMIQSCQLDHGGGFLLLGAYRHDEVDEDHPLWTWEKKPDAGFPVNCLDLSRLSQKDIGKLVASCLGQRVENGLVDHIFKESEGVPFYAIEMIRKYVDDGAVINRDGLWIANPDVHVPMPEKITRMIGYRLSRFNREERKLLETAAVLGKIFHAVEHEKLTGLDEDAYLDGLDTVLRHRVVVEIPGDPDFYRFSHDKIRETLLKEMSRKRFQVYHRKTAETLESIHEDYPEAVSERLARHFDEGREYDQAYHYHLISSEKALKSGAQIESSGHLRVAADYIARGRLKTEISARDRIRLQLDRGRLARRLSNMEEAADLLEDVLKEAETKEFEDLVAEAQLHLGSVRSLQGDLDAARSLLLTAMESFREQGNMGLQVDCLTNLGSVESLVSNHEANLEFHNQALTLAKQLDDPVRLVRTLLNMAYACMGFEMEPEALDHFRTSLRHARKLKDRRFVTFNLIGIAGLYINTGLTRKSAGRVLKITEEVMTDLTRTGDRMRMADCLFKRVQALDILGLPWKDDIERSFKIAQDFGITWLVDLIDGWEPEGSPGGSEHL